LQLAEKFPKEFTLTELMIVIAIIGILVIYPFFSLNRGLLPWFFI
jgi:prepilin-type N-terminal cleavage/methylation domain-containing protein